MTNKQAEQIILRHVVTTYGEDEGTRLFLQNRSKLFTYHGLAYRLGKKSLAFFCEYFLHDIYFDERCKPLAPIHYDMWHTFENMISNKTHERQCYILPRGTAKTTITMGVAIWAAVYGYKTFTLIASALQDTANSFIRNIRNAVEDNKRITQSFGTIFDRKNCTVNTEMIEFSNKTIIQSISAASSLRGKQYNNKRIELAILDDFQKADEIATEEQRKRKWKRFSDDIPFAMQGDNSTILALGTLQCLGDFYDRIRKSPSFLTKQEKCIPMDQKELDDYFHSGLWAKYYKIFSDIQNPYRLDDSKEFYYQHEAEMKFPMLWPDGWDCLDMAIKYYSSPESFHQEMQGEIERTGNKLIKHLSAFPASQIEEHKFIKSILSVDPASTTTKRSDYSAFCVLSQSDNNTLFARRSIIKKLDFDEYINQIIQLLIDYPDIKHISVEKNTYQGADVRKLREEIAVNPFLGNRQFTIYNDQRTKNKDARISAVIPDINNGRIIFNEEDAEAIDQIRKFAGTEYTLHDDMIDCLTDAVEHLPEMIIPKLKVLHWNI